MRRKLMLTLALGALLTVAGAAVATAKFDKFRFGNLVLEADGGVTPKALPKNKLTPVAVNVKGKIATVDGTHPDAFREATIDFDKNGVVNAKGIPVCKQGQLQAQDTKHAENECPTAIVGKGRATVEVEFPESKPFRATGPLVMFNGGVKGSKTLLLIHVYVSVPVPTALVTTVDLSKIHKGRYGIRTVSKIPRIAGGSGSTISFELTVKRNFTYKGKKSSYVMAKCPDGHFNANLIEALFKNEDKNGPEATSKISGTVIRACTPKG
jgi:hypothetical protein